MAWAGSHFTLGRVLLRGSRHDIFVVFHPTVPLQEAYDEWLCATFLELYNNTNGTVEVAKPCLGVCTRVVQQCPYYLPSKFQRMDSTSE